MTDSLSVPPAEPVADPVAAEPAPAAPAGPLAAAVVIAGEKTEREIELEKLLQEARDSQRKAETDASYAQDRARQLLEVQSRRPVPAPRKPGFTLLHGED